MMSLVAARDVLELLELGFKGTEFAGISKKLREEIEEQMGWVRPSRTHEQFGQSDMYRQQRQAYQEGYAPDAKRLVEAAAKLEMPKRRKKTFQTPVFKCLGDYESCLEQLADKSLTQTKCSTALIICIGKQLIPFANFGG
jgi:hypothetical protein